jgi:hypothetical protein
MNGARQSGTHHRAVENPCNPFPAARPQLEQPATHGPRVRHAQIEAKFFKQLGQTHIRRPYANRHGGNFLSYILAEVVDGP